MIITCNKCSTSFSLDDLLVKEEGSKVRCSVCKNIFTVFPGPGEAKQEPQALSGLTLESDGDDAFDASDDFGIHDNDLVLEEPSIIDEDVGDDDADDFSFEDDEFKFDDHKDPQGPEPDDESLEFEDDDIEFETEPDEDSDGIEFELMDDEPGSIDFEGDEPGLEMETQIPDMDSRTEDQSPEDVAFEDESSTEEGEFELEFDVEDDAEIEGFEDEPEEPALEMEMETEAEEAGLSLDYAGLKDEEGKDDEHTLMAPEDDFSGYDAVLEQKTEPEDEILVEEETIGVEDIPEREEIAVVEPQRPASTEPARAGRRKKKPLVGAPVLVLMLIALLVVGAYIASVMTGYNIPYLSDLKIPIVEQYL
jgi:predicted Zn finger-like uncharacterized protein